MKQYECLMCGYIYDEAVEGTQWEDLPDDWTCPLCGAGKDSFELIAADTELDAGSEETTDAPTTDTHEADDLRQLTYGELSVICSNLALGTTKQHRAKESALFSQLADYYQSKISLDGDYELSDLKAELQSDLEHRFPEVRDVVTAEADRGALRVLTWSNKVTAILNTLIQRYEKQGDALLEDTKIWVCEACGFVYLGEEAPEICPICKVPRLKIHEVKRG